jgi:hypothetical protein
VIFNTASREVGVLPESDVVEDEATPGQAVEDYGLINRAVLAMTGYDQDRVELAKVSRVLEGSYAEDALNLVIRVVGIVDPHLNVMVE